MAQPSLFFVIQDEKGQKSTVTLPVDPVAVGDVPIVLAAAAPVVKALVDGGLVRAGFTWEVDLSGSWSNVAAAASDVQEKAYFSFRTASNYLKSLTLPTIKEAIFIPGTKYVNAGNAAVAAFLTMIEDGLTGLPGNQVNFTDYRGDDIENAELAREAWGKYRKGD